MITKKQTLKAFDDSIAHWERLYEAYLNENEVNLKREEPTADNCALCKLYVIGEGSSAECPLTVYPEDEGLCDGCLYTPYEDAHYEWECGYRREDFESGGVDISRMIDHLRDKREEFDDDN